MAQLLHSLIYYIEISRFRQVKFYLNKLSVFDVLMAVDHKAFGAGKRCLKDFALITQLNAQIILSATDNSAAADFFISASWNQGWKVSGWRRFPIRTEEERGCREAIFEKHPAPEQPLTMRRFFSIFPGCEASGRLGSYA